MIGKLSKIARYIGVPSTGTDVTRSIPGRVVVPVVGWLAGLGREAGRGCVVAAVGGPSKRVVESCTSCTTCVQPPIGLKL